ncbi:MAG: DUF975 family protein [Clostridiales bacterium]|nr:DUF975 family protein [Clostridiales bacterium]
MEPIKELKRRGRSTVKHHYFLLLILCLLAVFWGTEFNSSGSLFNKIDTTTATQSSTSAPFMKDNASDVLNDIYNNNIKAGKTESNKILENYRSKDYNGKIVGRSRGSLARLANSVSSGQLYLKFASALNSITNSDKAVSVIFVIISLFFYLCIWIFLMNVYKVIMRRMFLEARTYKYVPLQRAIHLLSVRRWFRASMTVFVTYIFQFLWDLTIIGGVIKHYSYYLVPYIVAENPDIRPREAINLSRKMMYGHKWECFKYELSFIGWYILSAATLGLVSILYVIPYKLSTFCEYYMDMRAVAKENNLPGAEKLNDEYLFVKAPDTALTAAYSDTVKEMDYIEDNAITINTFQKLIADWLGIWLGRTKTKNAYLEIEGRKFQIRRNKNCLEGLAYPSRLNPLYDHRDDFLAGKIMFLRSYTVWTLLLMFFLFSFLGWCWEVSLHLIQDGEFVNRGTLFGPWLPIYGYGGIIVLVLLSKFRKFPVVEFLGAIVLCGILEYSSSYYLEAKYGMRWWDYTGYFLNLDGRICAEGLLVFAIAGMLIVYLIGPINDVLFSRISLKIVVPVVLCLVMLFAVDQIHSIKHPNMGKGVTDYKAYKETSMMMELKKQALRPANDHQLFSCSGSASHSSPL